MVKRSEGRPFQPFLNMQRCYRQITVFALFIAFVPALPCLAQTHSDYDGFKNQWNSLMAAVSDGPLKRQDCDLIYRQMNLIRSNQWLAELERNHPNRKKYLIAKENASANASKCRQIGHVPILSTASNGQSSVKGNNRTVVQGSQNVVNAQQVTHVHHHHYTTNNSAVNVNQPQRY